jgi:hypothetical protein
MDVIFELFRKYADLVLGVSIIGDVVMDPWPVIFRTAWIPEEAWEETMAEVERVGTGGSLAVPHPSRERPGNTRK